MLRQHAGAGLQQLTEPAAAEASVYSIRESQAPPLETLLEVHVTEHTSSMPCCGLVVCHVTQMLRKISTILENAAHPMSQWPEPRLK